MWNHYLSYYCFHFAKLLPQESEISSSGNAEGPKNTGPISMTSALAKIFEKTLKSKLLNSQQKRFDLSLLVRVQKVKVYY